MPTGGARTLNDLLMEGRERVGIACTRCERVGSYGLAGLISADAIDTRRGCLICLPS
jgi:hypothetical protein